MLGRAAGCEKDPFAIQGHTSSITLRARILRDYGGRFAGKFAIGYSFQTMHSTEFAEIWVPPLLAASPVQAELRPF
jgi:hypothetical protein